MKNKIIYIFIATIVVLLFSSMQALCTNPLINSDNQETANGEAVSSSKISGETPESTTISEKSVTKTETTAVSPTDTTSSQLEYTRRIGVGATSWIWFNLKYWQEVFLDTNVSWDTIDPVPFLAQHGFNWLRVEVWMRSAPELEYGVPYPGQWKDEFFCSRENILQVMRVGVQAGMHLCLQFSLNDKGACGSNQKAPAQWKDYSLEETAAALKNYTYETTKYYKDNGVKIELYEIGNEIEFGVCGYSNDTKLALPGVNYLTDIPAVRKGIWEKEAVLLKAAIEGVKQADPEAKTVLHISTAQWPDLVGGFFKAMNDFGVKYDYGGLSYYEWFNPHPTIPSPENFFDLSVEAIAKQGKKVIISEYSYPSAENPVSGFLVKEIPGYPFTPEGQAKWLRDFLLKAENNPNIESVFYFFPDHFLDQVVPQTALFLDDKHPKPAIYEFTKFQNDSDLTLPVIKSVSAEPKVVKNGNDLEISMNADEDGLYTNADVSQLDSTKNSTIVLKQDTNGIYKCKMTVSPGNEAENGIKKITVNATDIYGNTETTSVEIELKNDVSLSQSILSDDFDGNVLDTTKWKTNIFGEGTVNQDGKLILSTGNEEPTSIVKVQSIWSLIGDFDIQVDFQIGKGWKKPNKDHIDGATFGVDIDGQQYHITMLRRAEGDCLLFAWSSSGDILGEKNSNATSGKYRLVRAGDVLSFMYDIGDGWQELVCSNVPEDAANIYFGNSSINASQSFTSYFDNFYINSGTMSY